MLSGMKVGGCIRTPDQKKGLHLVVFGNDLIQPDSLEIKRIKNMPEPLEMLLSQLAKDQNLLHSVEEATKQGAVLPILNQIGWNCFNVQEVVPEFSVGTGRIDYCLCINGKNAVFIEVKRITEELERHEKQILDYSFEHGVNMVLT